MVIRRPILTHSSSLGIGILKMRPAPNDDQSAGLTVSSLSAYA
jgi:hypothetical protein